MLLKFLELLKLYPSKKDIELRNLVNNSYDSLRVVGRGTIFIDSSEVRKTKQFKQALKKAKQIVYESH